ncbi:hypothetical protein [Neomoorella mulderi]|uniref:hypothetical protein n=1 Tax=Neomoorella mulderi TaxID=202604 RepID=UPI000781B279|nr:hypothetical protein [Moorella mulderi]
MFGYIITPAAGRKQEGKVNNLFGKDSRISRREKEIINQSKGDRKKIMVTQSKGESFGKIDFVGRCAV